MLVIRCLLIYPNAESALNEDAGKLILEDYADFEKRARLMTKIHARPKENNSDMLSLDHQVHFLEYATLPITATSIADLLVNHTAGSLKTISKVIHDRKVCI